MSKYDRINVEAEQIIEQANDNLKLMKESVKAIEDAKMGIATTVSVAKTVINAGNSFSSNSSKLFAVLDRFSKELTESIHNIEGIYSAIEQHVDSIYKSSESTVKKHTEAYVENISELRKSVLTSFETTITSYIKELSKLHETTLEKQSDFVKQSLSELHKSVVSSIEGTNTSTREEIIKTHNSTISKHTETIIGNLSELRVSLLASIDGKVTEAVKAITKTQDLSTSTYSETVTESISELTNSLIKATDESTRSMTERIDKQNDTINNIDKNIRDIFLNINNKSNHERAMLYVVLTILFALSVILNAIFVSVIK